MSKIETMNINEAKDQAARENGWSDYKDAYIRGNDYYMSVITDRAMEIYAEAKAKEAYNQAINDAANSALITGEFPNGTTINGDDVVIPEGEIVNLKVSVSKQSILKLLK